MAHKASSSLALSACGGGDPPPLRVRGPVVKGVFIGPIVCFCCCKLFDAKKTVCLRIKVSLSLNDNDLENQAKFEK